MFVLHSLLFYETCPESSYPYPEERCWFLAIRYRLGHKLNFFA